MKFKYGTRRRAIEYEKAIADYWKENKTFEKSVEQRDPANSYVFYDGPPFITGAPHHGTLLSSIVKDAIPRYQTMKGKHVERRWGWDCHGLPAENFVEKQLGIEDRRQIGATEPIEKDGKTLSPISLEEYITKARESMVANSETWEQVIDRIGRWVDFRGAYRTMDKDFMESVWWAFKQFYDAGKIYEGEKVLMYDTKFATPVSKNEVTMDNDAYQTVTDPSVFVKFRVKKPIKNAVAYYIKKDNGEFLSVKRNPDDDSLPNVWGLPAATMKGDEDLEAAVRRGAQEKLGIKVKKMEFIGDDEIERDDFILRLSDFQITEYEGEPKLQNGNEFYAQMAWQKDPEIYFEAANKGSLCTRIFLRKYVDKNLTFTNPAVENKFLLAWTTTPWTLPANMALAVNLKMKYVEAEVDGENLILAKDLVEKVLVDEKHQPLDYKIVREMIGKDLVGAQYVPLFSEENESVISENAHKIYAAEFVEDEGGTGIVHVAPTYGPDDFELAQENNIPVLHTIDDDGYYLPEFAAKLEQIGVRPTDENGIEVWAANKFIAKCLEEKGIVWKIDYIQHEYPFNPRSKQRIMYRAIPSWFFDVQGQKPLMLEQNENINWFPEHIKHGRFAKNIEAAPDWNLSRDRFWATAMPVWKGDKGSVRVVGSYDELEKLSGVKLDDYHRPWVDDVEFDLPVGELKIKNRRTIDIVKKLGLPHGNYTVFGSAIMEVYGLKNAGDIDLLVNKKLFNGLAKTSDWKLKKYPNGDPALKYKNGRIEAFYYCEVIPGMTVKNVEKLIANSKMLDGVSFLDLETTKQWKKKFGHEKDLRDVETIERYLSEDVETEHFTRIDKVLDCWFESGSMPFAQLHYPFENKEKFEKNYPADFIVEYMAQVRAWFYYVHTVNTGLAEIGAFGNHCEHKNAFKNVITTGTLAGNDGRKMSKSLGNYTDPNELMDKFSADSLRFLMLSSPVLSGEDFSLTDKDVGDVARKLSMIWNMYDFFTMYAEVDGWEFDGDKLPVLSPNDVANPLDKWIISRVHQLVEHVTRHMDGYNLPEACSETLPFLDDASNWYVRRSRRRFWKSEDDADKDQAYQTLHYVLVKIAQILAPFTPFLAEELYQKLTGGESVHLLDWPEVGEIDEKVLIDMKRARKIIEQGLALRMEHDEFGQIKVRQPLSKLEYNEEKLDEFYEQIVAEEVNVKGVVRGDKVSIDKNITPELKREGQAREIIRVIQKARKNAELNVDDRIILNLKTGDEDLQKALDEWRETIATETLAAQFAPNDGCKTAAKIDNIGLEIQLKKDEK